MNNPDINMPVVESLSDSNNGNGLHSEHRTTQKYKNYNDIPENKNDDIIEVLFKGNRRNFYETKGIRNIQPDDRVVVSTDCGIDLGLVTYIGDSANARLRSCQKNRIVKFDVLRIATELDIDQYFLNTSEEPIVVKRSRDLINTLNLDMKVTESEWQLDRQRLTIFFTAPQRIDFRELVKELARTFRTRIELRQISAREETKRIGGGVGACGLNLCCTSFMSDFNHITLDHARLQQLSNNVNKLSGYCGRLKCCLLFEYETYNEAFKGYPQLYSRIKTDEGLAKLIKVDIFKNISTIHYRDSGKYQTLSYEELSEYIKANKVIPPAREDLDPFFGQHGIQTKRDMLGDVYIVEEH